MKFLLCVVEILTLETVAMLVAIRLAFVFRSHYDKPESRAQLPRDLDISMYVASGVVVYDLHTRVMKWQVGQLAFPCGSISS